MIINVTASIPERSTPVILLPMPHKMLLHDLHYFDFPLH
jgi:hypothetical protein